jgi:predicted alpha/beta superfamily hydrolase
MPNARQYEFKSQINGQTYRIWIAKPLKADPAVAYPVLYVLDGNVSFHVAAEIESKLSFDREVAPAVIVGIGYPTDDLAEWNRRRVLDLTPFVDKGAAGRPANSAQTQSGGGELFLRVIEEEIKPFVSSRYKVDSAKQALYGHSLGGLLTMHELFLHPAAYSAYILASPSIFYNDNQVLIDEAVFSKQARAGALHLRILVTQAGDERNAGGDPRYAHAFDDTSALADRLAEVDPTNISVSQAVFEGESHTSGLAASLARAIRFALPPK